jgi:hypothetical protein
MQGQLVVGGWWLVVCGWWFVVGGELSTVSRKPPAAN